MTRLSAGVCLCVCVSGSSSSKGGGGNAGSLRDSTASPTSIKRRRWRADCHFSSGMKNASLHLLICERQTLERSARLLLASVCTRAKNTRFFFPFFQHPRQKGFGTFPLIPLWPKIQGSRWHKDFCRLNLFFPTQEQEVAAGKARLK